MTRDEALRIAQDVVGDAATVTIHQGDHRRALAVRLSGVDLRYVDPLGWQLEAVLPGGKYVRDGNFAAVWYDA